MTENVQILDHGYCRLVEHYGSDERIVESARMSTQGGFVSWDPYEGHPKGDTGLLSHLYKNNHATPFEMAGATFEVMAPIAVFREWHRHRTQGYNEASARYAPLPNVNYVPTVERCMMNAGKSNRQAGTVDGAAVLTAANARKFRARLEHSYAVAEDVYQDALADGIPKELARLCMPVGRYSKMRAIANLRNWIGFLKLRQDVKAQWEIRQYANAVAEMLASQFPRTMDLYEASRV